MGEIRYRTARYMYANVMSLKCWRSCMSWTVKTGKNVWITCINQHTILHSPRQCQNCSVSIDFTHHVRQCSQFTVKADKMDGNYRLKDERAGSRVRELEGEKQKADETAVLEKKKRLLPPCMEARARYYESRAFKVRKYQWEGKACGIDPAIMWPSRTELEKIKAYEKEWSPTLQEMQTELERERQVQRLKTLKREKIIRANMAKMPQMIKEYEGKLDDQKRQEEEQKKKRARLLEEARVKLGYNIDHRSHYFKAMLEEMEKEERKRKKELRKKARMAKLGIIKQE